MKAQRTRPPKIRLLVEDWNGSLLVAAMEGRALNGLEVDPISQEVRWGSLYWGRVEKIDKALDAAFVNLDGDNIGLLHGKDVRSRQDGKFVSGGEVGIGKLLTAGQYILVQAKDDYLRRIPDDEEGTANLPLERKHPRLSMAVTLPGRFLIYAPYEHDNQISQRIRDKVLRKQLEAMLDQLTGHEGFILRAAAADTQTDILAREAKILRHMWEQILPYAEGEEPQLIMLGPDAIHRSLSDMAASAIDKIEVNAPDQFEQVADWCELFAPDLLVKVDDPGEMLDDNSLALFAHYDLMLQIEMLFRPYFVLPSGGSCIIEDTAAATLIDVNRGADRKGNLSVNLEAAEAIARQLRIRNMGGAILIDFLKLKSPAEKKSFLQALDKMVQSDPCTVQIHGLTKLGFLEVTRNRRTLPLIQKLDQILNDDD